jgi:D-beta-D-heptose 7-phosphate kinase/D-beta-D-heptose 1-phosphate adenosyltransferase
MLDKYISGDVTRISPEAPVPVMCASQESYRLGGAANVAANLAGLGVQASLAGFVGNDQGGASVKELLESAAVSAHLVETHDFPTTSKTRIVSGHQQIIRVDTEKIGLRSVVEYNTLLSAVDKQLCHTDAIILCDYGKGVLSSTLCRDVLTRVRAQDIPVFVGAKGNDFSKYTGSMVICLNLQELSLLTGGAVDVPDRLFTLAHREMMRLGTKYFVVTMGDKGIALVDQQSVARFPARARQVFDVTGAGDTVLAAVSTCMTTGMSVETVCELANVAAGLVVAKAGTAAVHREELVRELVSRDSLRAEDKILCMGDLLLRVRCWRGNGETIVFTNGCFDLLHAGHVALLEAARKEGTRLIVALNSDASVRRLKGRSRPLNEQLQRARVIAALAAVDAVTIFEEDNPLECIRELRPDVIVKGGDYVATDVVGYDEVQGWNGRVAIVPTVGGVSSTRIMNRILQQQVGSQQ